MPVNNLQIHADIAPKLNFAAHQSAFTVLRSLRVQNLHDNQRVEHLLLTLQSNPEFIKEKSWVIDRIAPEGLISILDRDLEVDGGFLMNIAESIRGDVTFRLEKDGNFLAELAKPVELLAYNEWGGVGYMPELLAAFSMPNDPAVDKVLHSASEILRRAGKREQIDGYQSQSRERVWEIASAIYSAIANLGLTYAAPPASFENDGQKIRLPAQILDSRVATCLDSAMLFASAFEQAGFNPIIALPKGHALAGVWLQPEDLSTIVIDEAETLRKRIDLKELTLIETTCVTSHPTTIFSNAIAAAGDSIRVDFDNTFSAAVDIRRARAHSITPLGLKFGEIETSHGTTTVNEAQLSLEPAPSLPDFDSNELDDGKTDTPENRLERWQRKLLDLTLRNPLLNHRATKASLRIICPDPHLLEDKLAEGARIMISPVPQPSSENQDDEIHRQREGVSITEEYARNELEKRRVLVDLPQEQLSKRAVEIYRKAQTSLQEGGANTLYLAIGFLLWKRDLKEDRRFRAPLILLPITLERKSVRSGIRMTAHDDEPRFNTTLLEMLRRDFRIDIPGLDGALPEDNSGIDVENVWNKVRLAVKDAPGFEVIDDVVLGHFSFAKFLMWKDLVDRTEDLRNNAVVRHLMDTPRDPYAIGEGFVDPRQLDQIYSPSDLLVTLPADSSQMAAVATADRGKDFVLIGPPGTGKSQTISNIIGHLLGKGKTVLFVSEKTAALEVVYNRLVKVGLGRFCLELHSNKAKKADVLKQLGLAWEAGTLELQTAWKQKADTLLVLRNRLNQLVNHLHKKHRNGLTAHYAIGVRVKDGESTYGVTLSWPNSDYDDEKSLKAKREVVENLSIQAKAVGDFSQSPFFLVEKSKWSPQWEERIVDRVNTLSVTAGDVEHCRDALCNAIGFKLPDHTMTRLEALGELAFLLLDSYRRPTAYALAPDGTDRIETLNEAVGRLKKYREAQASLSCAYKPFSWRTLDGEQLELRWKEANTKWWLVRIFSKQRIIKEMRANGAEEKPDPTIDIPLLTSLRQEGKAIDRLDQLLSDFKEWSGHTTEPEAADTLRRLGERARAVVGKLVNDPQSLVDVRIKIRTMLHDGNDLLSAESSIGRLATVYLDALEKLQQAIGEFETVAGGSVRKAFSNSYGALSEVQQMAETIRTRHSELNSWCAWRRRRAEAIVAGLLPLVQAVEQGRIPPEEIENTFEAAYCTWWSTAVIEEDEVLRSFSAPEHEAIIDKFRRIDDEFQALTAKYIEAMLSGALPDQENIKKSSGWGVLRRELQKTRRHKPVRKLLEEAPDVLTSLTPCFMMSPLSVAQYLPADQALFDVVIFDEASQITVWDAVGSIARGRQVIVTGDPKQMPPTNFFTRTDDDPDGDIDMEGDLESILDEMLGASIPSTKLNLHYRSRFEGLIAFSNDRYYSNDLITFPAPEVVDRAVSLVRLDSFYARGGARNNQGEAKAIVDETIRRLTHNNPEIGSRSIGIVTFNSEQQTLIEDMLDDARRKHPEIEPAFSREHVAEPVFVKNLETVQGDERDVVLFSITYGPDRSGHVTMNFGPLNREGGERRLNVAITRARVEMIVFSSLHPDQIDLSRSQARAVADLKHFLEYAERGQVVLGSTVQGYREDFESPFEVAVAQELQMLGWQVHPQVGVSAYRIDLGIVHPDKPGRYLAGIECDGAMYHSSAFARERDKIRQSVLENLGWTIFRIWSTDWWTNKEGALKKINDALHHCLNEARSKEVEQQYVDDPGGDKGNEVEVVDIVIEESTPDVSGYMEPEHLETTPTNSYHAPYSEFEGQAGPDPRNATIAQVTEGLCRIIQEEGPILAKRAYDTYLRGCGIRRMGGDLKRMMNKALSEAIRKGLIVKQDEWGKGGSIHSIVRLPDTPPVVVRERGSRSFDEIPPSELQLVARQLFQDHNGELEPDSEAHLRAVLGAFDLRRLTAPVGAKLLDILQREYSYVDDVIDKKETQHQ